MRVESTNGLGLGLAYTSQHTVTSAATQPRPVTVSCSQSEASILVSDWLQLTDFGWDVAIIVKWQVLIIKTRAKVKLKNVIFNQFIFFSTFRLLRSHFQDCKYNIGLITYYKVQYKIWLICVSARALAGRCTINRPSIKIFATLLQYV